MLGEVKKVTVKVDGEIVGTRRNTRNYTHAVVNVETKSVMSYHLSECAACGRAGAGYAVVPTEIEYHVWKKFGVVYKGRTYERETAEEGRFILLIQARSDPAPSPETYKTAAAARKWGEYVASDRCTTDCVLAVVLPATLAPYREPPSDQVIDLMPRMERSSTLDVDDVVEIREDGSAAWDQSGMRRSESALSRGTGSIGLEEAFRDVEARKAE
jgi:hypothetical protein